MTKSKLFRAILIAAIGGAAMAVNTGAYAGHRDHDRWGHRVHARHVHHHRPIFRPIVVREPAVVFSPLPIVYGRPGRYGSGHYVNEPVIAIGVNIPPLVFPLY